MKRPLKKKLIQMMRMAMEALGKMMKTQSQTTTRVMNRQMSKKPPPAAYHPPVNMVPVKTQKLDSPVDAMKDIQVGYSDLFMCIFLLVSGQSSDNYF